MIVTTLTAAITWEKTFGGADFDAGLSVQQTTDGGYIIAGATGSKAYLIKTDDGGNELWSKTYGGTDDVIARCVRQTTDGGYIIAGEVLYQTAGEDFYLLKTNASGEELWSKKFDLRTTDRAYSVQETNDGGYIIVGETYTYVGGIHDVWLIKTDADGKELWSKTYGGASYDGGRSVQQTTDGGYIIAGSTSSLGAGSWNFYLVKTDADGNELWHKAFGGGGADGAEAVQQTTDGGYIIIGSTYSFGAGSYDAWLIKTDASGNELWSKTFGGSSWDYGFSVQQTTDGGYMISGFTGSFGAGNADAWLIRADASGNEMWSKTFGGSGYDRGYSAQQTRDDGYIIAGDTDSYGAGGSDVYLIYYKPDLPSKAINPNPSNGSTDIFISTDVSWANGGGATSYDVYFGTDPAPDSGEFKGNQMSTTYDPGRLAPETTYYWRIDAKNEFGPSTGDVWSFTTRSAQAMPWIPFLLMDD